MSPENDHWSAMTHLPDQPRSSLDRDLDSLGNGGSPLSQDLHDVAAFLTQLRGLADRPAPTPSAQLASVLAHGFAPDVPTTRPTREVPRPALSSWWRRGALAFGLSAGLSASLVGVAAASGQLPDGARAVVDRIVEAVTPFDVGSAREPHPKVDDNPAPVPPPTVGEAGQDTRTVPSLVDDAPAEDGGKGSGSGEKSGHRPGHDRDTARETDAGPLESDGREDRSGSSGAESDANTPDDADHDGDAEHTADEDAEGVAADESGEGPEDGGGAPDGEESGAEHDPDE